MKFSSLPTPPALFRQFENGEISREELQATMALHARDLIEEMVETRKNPVAAYVERLRNQAAVRKLAGKHTSALLREVFSAMGEIPGFPPAHLLWNASHRQMPLHCFIRMKHEPVFRVTKMDVSPMKVSVQVEYGQHDKDKTTRELIVLHRNPTFKFELLERRENTV
ncbi:MAG: hypothetical protein P1V20_14725 [Verrucomicrobiales bacterium]|nr:hypothetical protein [Verrucomicrobiales bacterium]